MSYLANSRYTVRLLINHTVPMTLITMSSKEIDRFVVITSLKDGRINGNEAAEQLHLSVRQIRRLKKRFRKNNPRSLVHRGRGQSSNRKFDTQFADKIIKLIKKDYVDFGPTLAAEKLLTINKLKISDESLRTLMSKNNLWKPRRRKSNGEHHEWRPRKENYGAMEQYDGCYHHWFENRADECCLLLSVDDATGRITKAVFDLHEGIIPTFRFWQDYINENGKPAGIYLDKFSTYKINHKNAKDNSDMITQFQRVCRDINITLISAHSPEAKGRVERMFQTLQDRLVKELRLQNISDIAVANKFLKEKYISAFNKKFAVVPVKRADLHRPMTKTDKENSASIFSIHDQRVVMNDFTVQFKTKYFQLNQQQPVIVCRKDKVAIEEHLDGSIELKLRGKSLACTILPKRPEKVCLVKIPALTTGKPTYKPPASHPWRNQLFGSKIKSQPV